ncbi:MAG TPA: YceI family protein [Mycobacteriales bacterium]|nr:YceI family protein [Mycobacteriales bacterium]
MTDMHPAGPAGPIPPTGRYAIDPEASSVAFRTRHMFGLAPVTGTFAIRDGGIDIADPIAESRVRVEVDVASFDTGNRQRDDSVRSARYLDAGRHPTITFTSQRLDPAGGASVLEGSLTAKGVTRPVRLVGLTIESPTSADPDSFVALATTRVDRTEFGVTASRGMAGRHLDVSLRVVCLRR